MRRWDDFADTFAEDHVRDDRRAGLGNIATKDQLVDGWKALAGLDYNKIAFEPIAMRGMTLSLQLGIVTGSHEYETDALTVIETDKDGRIKTKVYFNPDDLGPALRDLDERYMAGEGAANAHVWNVMLASMRAYTAHDWSRLREPLAADFVLVDHRPAYLGTVHTIDQLIPALQAQVEMAPDLYIYSRYVDAINDHGVLHLATSKRPGPGGGDIEIAMWQVAVVRSNKIVRVEFFPVESYADARRRFEELTSREDVVSNACFEVVLDILEAAGRRDDHAIAQRLASEVWFDDRQSGVRRESHTREGMLDVIRAMYAVGIDRVSAQCHAVRGDRLCLATLMFRNHDGFCIKALDVFGVDDAGQLGVFVGFDLGDIEEGFAELEARYLAGEGATNAEIVRVTSDVLGTYNRRDWAAYRALCADDLSVIDHRRVSTGTYVGADQFVRNNRVQSEVVPDWRMFVESFISVRGPFALTQMTGFGMNSEGGEISADPIGLWRIEHGRIVHFEYLSRDQLPLAKSRFEESASQI